MAKRAVFFDRDGTLIVNVPYCSRIEDIRFYEDSFESLAMLTPTDLLSVVVTNQSGIGRGYLDGAILEKLHGYMRQEVARRGGRIDAFFHCPHLPDAGCSCRKPRPGLLLRASAELEIDLRRSFLVGDSESDVRGAIAAQCQSVIVRRDEARGPTLANFEASSLKDAMEWIFKESGIAVPR